MYYGLDLGGTNFRVLRVQLGGQRSAILEPGVERQPIPEHLMTSTSEVAKFVIHMFENFFFFLGFHLEILDNLMLKMD